MHDTDRLNDLERRVSALEQKRATTRTPVNTSPPPRTTREEDGGPIADDRDLDGERGNPEVRHDPRGWRGPSQIGRTYSQCPPEFLRLYAGLLEWKAARNDEDGRARHAEFDRRDAARARGWARRAEPRAANGSGIDTSNDGGDEWGPL